MRAQLTASRTVFATVVGLFALTVVACSSGTTPTASPAPTVALDGVGYAGTGTSSAVRVELPAGQRSIAAYPAYDAIRPIYEPTFVSSSETLLEPRDFVIGVALNGEARAYPVRILRFREMVNDVVGGVPLLATW